MCRWLAYSGEPLRLDGMLLNPNHSLIDQSLHARMNFSTTNADGFGMAWYGGGDEPGLYRDVRPAWNDENLRRLARHLRSPLFFAHVRAATGTPVQRTNCHPFQHGRWIFQHNGVIPGFRRVKRELMFDVAPELFVDVAGSTDSELMFFLALTYGLDANPVDALRKMIGRVEQARHAAGITDAVAFTASIADGRRLYAVRYASHGRPPTLFLSRDVRAMDEVPGEYGKIPEGSVLIVSEPLDDLVERWEEVPPATVVQVADGEVTTGPFAPE